MPTWDAELYLRYADERTRPSQDLIAAIPLERPARIVDIGCGPGNSTELLKRRWPDAEVIGLDSSPEMLAEAARRYPDGRWVLGNAVDWTPPHPVDLVFANASLQWLRDHASLVPRLLRHVAPGGVLAVQLPAHFASALHQHIRRVAEDPEWQHLMAPARRALTVEPPAFYFDLLHPLVERLDMWATEYFHAMSDAEAIVQWIQGTGLRPFLEALETDAQRERFLEMLRTYVRDSYSTRPNGQVLFPFRRLFIVAKKPANG